MPIGLWAARLGRSLTLRETKAMLYLLPPERRERLLLVKQEQKRQEVLCAYTLLRLALRETLGWNTLPDIAKTQQGKPFFPAHPEAHFNISHTGGAVLVGISDQPIGVDIEHIRPVSVGAMERLAKAHTPEEFFQLWVRREARVKRSGNGISTMMRTESPLQHGEFYYPLEVFADYAAGVATGSMEQPPAVQRYILDELL